MPASSSARCTTRTVPRSRWRPGWYGPPRAAPGPELTRGTGHRAAPYPARPCARSSPRAPGCPAASVHRHQDLVDHVDGRVRGLDVAADHLGVVNLVDRAHLRSLDRAALERL